MVRCAADGERSENLEFRHGVDTGCRGNCVLFWGLPLTQRK